MSPREPAPFWRTLTALVALFAAFGLAQGCAEVIYPVLPPAPPSPVVPVDPVTPGPVVPVDPVTPGPVVPVDPAQVVPYARVATIRAGMTMAEVEAAAGIRASLTTPQDDGTTAQEWPAVGPAGEPVYLEVTYGKDGLSLPHALIPRPE